MPPLKDLARYTQNLPNRGNGGKVGGAVQYPEAGSHHQFSHQQFFNQYADQHAKPMRPNHDHDHDHGQHNHQNFFQNYSTITGHQQQQPYYQAGYNNGSNNPSLGITATSSVLTTVHNTNTVAKNVLHTTTTATHQPQSGFQQPQSGSSQPFSYQPSYSNYQGVTSTSTYGGSGQDFLKKID